MCGAAVARCFQRRANEAARRMLAALLSEAEGPPSLSLPPLRLPPRRSFWLLLRPWCVWGGEGGPRWLSALAE